MKKFQKFRFKSISQVGFLTTLTMCIILIVSCDDSKWFPKKRHHPKDSVITKDSLNKDSTGNNGGGGNGGGNSDSTGNKDSTGNNGGGGNGGGTNDSTGNNGGNGKDTTI